MPDPSNFQAILVELARCIEMRDRWACAVIYLHETGDAEAAADALQLADLWRDRAESIECEWLATRE